MPTPLRAESTRLARTTNRRELDRGYAIFYGVEQTDAAADTVGRDSQVPAMHQRLGGEPPDRCVGSGRPPRRPYLVGRADFRPRRMQMGGQHAVSGCERFVWDVSDDVRD